MEVLVAVEATHDTLLTVDVSAIIIALATLITALTTAIVTLRNTRRIDRVHSLVSERNGETREQDS